MHISLLKTLMVLLIAPFAASGAERDQIFIENLDVTMLQIQKAANSRVRMNYKIDVALKSRRTQVDQVTEIKIPEGEILRISARINAPVSGLILNPKSPTHVIEIFNSDVISLKVNMEIPAKYAVEPHFLSLQVASISHPEKFGTLQGFYPLRSAVRPSSLVDNLDQQQWYYKNAENLRKTLSMERMDPLLVGPVNVKKVSRRELQSPKTGFQFISCIYDRAVGDWASLDSLKVAFYNSRSQISASSRSPNLTIDEFGCVKWVSHFEKKIDNPTAGPRVWYVEISKEDYKKLIPIGIPADPEAFSPIDLRNRF